MFPQEPANPNGDIEIGPSPGDTVSCLSWSPRNNFLVSTSWDSQARLWEIQPNTGKSDPKAMTNFDAPPLSCCWSDDGSKVFVSGCDNKAHVWDIASGSKTQIAEHSQPIKFIQWLSDKNIVMTCGWDKSVRFWDGRQPTPALVIDLPERVFCADAKDILSVIATADKKILIYNLNNPKQVYKSIESPLKYQSKCIKCFTDKTGFALGSVEGRVAIQYVEGLPTDSKNFSFKCHRHEIGTTKNFNVFAVNDISFHPANTFATCGGDGAFHFWDKDSKQRLKQFKRAYMPVTCSAFSADGSIFAYAIGYDWQIGHTGFNNTYKSHIFIHKTNDSEIKPRPRTNATKK